ncbi:hypothetical protein ABZ436_08400 [Micromonospora matsumotoense]|uniref:hypothetical protein n=1 Tax=Micromonospora matsumotoense TaxID=121616 RepID=UPI0033D5F599
MLAGSDTEEIILTWQRADRPGVVEFVVTAQYAGEVRALLAAQDVAVDRSPAVFRTTGSDLMTTLLAVADTPAAWVAVGVGLKAFFDRHRGKRIKVDEDGLTDASNYSAREIERIIRALARPDATGDGTEDSPRDQ